MNTQKYSRRQALAQAAWGTGAALAGGWASGTAAAATPPANESRFVLCFNTATILGQKVGIAKEVEIAAQAGYQALEPWVSALDQYAKGGGSLKDLRQRIADAGLTVESSIGFTEWVVDDDARRGKGLERMKSDMDLVAQIGGKRIAAPPSGATDTPGLDLAKAAERYRALLELGDQMGVTPQLELWGFSKNLNRLGPCAYAALESGHPKACVLADVFHLHKGGSDFRALRLLSGAALQVFHMNDFPAEPGRDKINDSFRTYPGDGVAPLTQILRDLWAGGGTKVLSLELFSRKYWEQDPLEVAKAGLEKLKAEVRKAVG